MNQDPTAMKSSYSKNRSRTFRRAAERAAAKNQKVGSNFSLFATSTLVAGGFVGLQAGPAFANGNDFVSCSNLGNGLFDDAIAITLDGSRSGNWTKIVNAANIVSDPTLNTVDKLVLCKDPNYTVGVAALNNGLPIGPAMVAEVNSTISLVTNDHLEILNASGFLVLFDGFSTATSYAFDVDNAHLELNSEPVWGIPIPVGIAFNGFDSDEPIYASQSTLDISRTLFVGNSSSAIRSEQSEVSIDYSIFLDNYSDDGGAVDSYESSISVSRSTFTANRADGYGGAIYMENYGTLRVTDSYFSLNEAEDGGAIGLEDDSDTVTVTIQRTIFSANVARDEGGAIYVKNDDYVTIQNSYFDRNHSGADGGAIYMDGDGDSYLKVQSSRFVGNTSDEGGGAIYLEEVNLYVYDSLFAGNLADFEGGAIFAEDTVGYTTVVSRNSFFDNKATDGSAIYIEEEHTSLSEQGILVITNNTFEGNLSLSEDVERAGDVNFVQGYVAFNTFSGDSLWINDDFDYGPVTSSGSRVFGNIFTSPDDFGISGNVQRTSQVPENAFIDSNELEFVDADWPNLAHFEPSDQSDAAGFGQAASLSAKLPAFVLGVINERDQIGQSRTTPPLTAWTAGSIQTMFEGIPDEEEEQEETGFPLIPPFTGPPAPVETTTDAPVTTNPGTSTPGSVIAQKVVPGFAANSVKLTASMRSEIKKFVKANPEATTVTCKGFTSSPATAIDLRLARQRGQAVCDFVKKLNPEITVKVLKGSHNNEPGNQIRRARIVLR
jgi:predicted outer membrane repeat protein